MFRGRWLVVAALVASFLSIVLPDATAQIRLGVDQRVGNTRGWTVGISNSLAGCLAVATYRDQTTVWFGIGKDLGPYIAFTNPRWDRINPGEKYSLRLQMGRQGTWNGQFTGIDHGSGKGLITTQVNPKFFGDFARAGGITVIYQGNSLAKFELLGSRAALEDIINCERTRPAVAATAPSAQPAARSKERSESFGTGFFVSRRGHVLTNHHVVEGCARFKLTHGSNGTESVRIAASDAKNDLALLTTNLTPDAVPAFRLSVKVGEGISVYGYPLAGLLASTGNFTTGNVTANAGLADDTRMVQISAPVQPGNSGGPLLDRHGNVVGVIVSKLNALRVAQATQDLPQNVNFAIKSVIAASFMDANDLAAETTVSSEALDSTQIAERAKAFTVRISCK